MSAVVFALMALLAGMVTSLTDERSPVALRASEQAWLTFDPGTGDGRQQLRDLVEANQRFALGLVKVVPDLDGGAGAGGEGDGASDQGGAGGGEKGGRAASAGGQLIVPLDVASDLPEVLPRFGVQADSRRADLDHLEESPPSGGYFVTGDAPDLEDFRGWLDAEGIGQDWFKPSLRTLAPLVLKPAVLAVVAAAIILMAAAALAWFTARARSRAIRTLNGASARRVDREDMAGFLAPVAAGALAVWAVTGVAVGIVWGWAFWGFYSTALAVLGALVLVGAALAGALVALAARPSVDMIANRVPAARALARPAKVVAFAAFALVVGVASPAWGALAQSRDSATTQGAWNRFADQTELVFTGHSLIGDSTAVDAAVAQLVAEAQPAGAAALSMFQDTELFSWARPLLEEPAEKVLGGADGLGFVNPVWMELAGFTANGEAREGMRRVQPSELHPLLVEDIGGELDLLMNEPGPNPSSDASPGGELAGGEPVGGGQPGGGQPGTGEPGGDLLDRVELWVYSGADELPMVRQGGTADMRFVSSAVLVVIEDLTQIRGFSLASLASQSSLTFSGLDATRALINANGLADQVYPQRMAESGILSARYAAVFAWMMGAAFAAMVAALAVAAATSAFIAATRHARRDHGLALSGWSWSRITRGRALSELWSRVAFVALVCVWLAYSGRTGLGRPDRDGGGLVAAGLAVTCLVAAVAVGVGWAAHVRAARAVFGAVNSRRA
ncbi:MAG: hypothetical protein LBK95_04840 [Bifidobacteriaceae bacterium]|jgi:hypothetical protein|nr:hypothetical protein [Bifidobacteriaceae bacterium]